MSYYISKKMEKHQAGGQKNQIKYTGDSCMGEEGSRQRTVIPRS